MFSKQELKIFLEEISENAKFLKFTFYSEEKFIIEMRSKVEDNKTPDFYSKYLSKWMEKFSRFTSTPWIVRQSYPNMKRMLYRKSYVCGRASRNKKPGTDAGTRNQGCHAKIDFKFKITNRNTMKNDPLLREKLNLCIWIDFVHSHKVKGREALKFLKSASDTDDKFYEYIRNGYSPAMAKTYHELIVIDKYGEHSEALKNPTINPTISHVMYLYNKAKKDGKEAPSFEEVMAAKKEKMKVIGGTISYVNQDTVVVVTPTMKRVLASVRLDDVVVTSAVVSPSNVVTSMFAPSQIGALCFACVLHKEQTEAAYSQAFFALKRVLEDEVKAFEPITLAVDNVIEQRSALQAIYTKSNVLISPWSLCTQTWRWICDDENKIDKRRRHELMAAFYTMLQASDADTVRRLCAKLKENAYVSITQNVTDYLNTLWHNQRLFWKPGEHKNLLELSIKIFNEFLLTKCKSFNLPAMVNVVMNIIDSHFRQVLWSCIKNEAVLSTYTKFLEKSESVRLKADLKIIRPHEYKLERKGEKSKWSIKFRTDTMCCNCVAGERGQLCAHLCAIIDTDIDFKIAIGSENEKSKFITIAGDPIEEFQNNKDYAADDVELKSEDDMDNVSVEEDTTTFNEAEDQFQVSPKDEVDDDYYYLEIKTENTERNDPLEEITEFNNEELLDTSSTQQPVESFKEQYEEAIKAVNSEFRRLNKYFKQNANACNLSTMTRLARELAKIRPVERVSFSGMVIQLNSESKRTRSDED